MATLTSSPLPTRKTGAWIALFTSICCGWGVAGYLMLYRMGYAGLDDWATFAPGAAAKRPLGLTTPLIGDFLGADHTWGIHWPGSSLLVSCVFAIVPWSPLARVVLMMGLCMATAATTFLLIKRYGCDPCVAAAGATIVLGDGPLVGLMGIARPEVLSTLVLAGLVFFLSERDRAVPRRTGRLVGTGVCFFLLPLLHPVLVPLGGLLCVYVGWRAWRAGRWWQGVGWVLCYGTGLAAFVAWFYFQPDALQQFRLNAAANVAPFRGLGTFVAFLSDDPVRFTNFLLYFLTAVGLASTWRWWRPAAAFHPDDPASSARVDWAVPVITLLGGTASAQLFHNPCYQVILLPEAVLLAALGMQWLVDRFTSRADARVRIAAFALLGFAALHGLFWVSRTLTFFRAGRPDFRAEIHHLALSMPGDQTILIPDLLWEEGIQQPPGHFVLYTLPFPCRSDVRQAYEDRVFQRAKSGDLLLFYQQDIIGMLTPLTSGQWEVVGTREHHLPSRAYWGYKLTIYRRK